MAEERWQTTFDLIGLTAYITLMTGQLPDSEFLRQARRGSRPQLLDLASNTDQSAGTLAAVEPATTAEAAA